MKKFSCSLKPSKSEVVTLLCKTLENFIFISKFWCINSFSQKMRQSKYMHFLTLLLLVFFNILHGSFLCHLFFLIYTWTTYQMIQYPLSNGFVDDVLLSFIILINAKTWAYELNLNFKNKSEWKLCHFMNSDLKKQAQPLEVTFSKKTKSYH